MKLQTARGKSTMNKSMHTRAGEKMQKKINTEKSWLIN